MHKYNDSSIKIHFYNCYSSEQDVRCKKGMWKLHKIIKSFNVGANAWPYILFISPHYRVSSLVGIYDHFLQRCNAVQPGRNLSTLQRNVLPPFLGLRSKPTSPLSSTLSDNGYMLTGCLGVPFWPVSEPHFSTHSLRWLLDTCLVYSLILKIVKLHFSKMSMSFYQTVRHFFPKDTSHHSYRCDNLNSNIWWMKNDYSSVLNNKGRL
jgi:hypothetical protein